MIKKLLFTALAIAFINLPAYPASFNQDLVIGIDLGGTKTAIAVVDREGTIHESRKFPTAVEAGPQAILQNIAKEVEELKKSATGSIVAVGIGITGQIDDRDGSVIFSPNLQWHNVPVQEELSTLTQLPVTVMCDVWAAAMGEWLHGAGKGCDDIVCLFVGTGIGGGVISKGEMLRGFSNAAGEVGHTTILMNGDRCHCGNYGCLETLAAGWAIAKKAKEEIAKDPLCGKLILEKAHGNIEEITTKLIVEAFHEGDPLAARLIEQLSDALTVAGINIANAFNPGRLILGGGVLKDLPEVLNHIEAGIQEYALKAASRSLTVLKAELDGNAGVVGAAIFAWEQYQNTRN